MKRVAGYIGSEVRKSEVQKVKKTMSSWCAEHEMTVTEWLDGKCGSIGEVCYGNWLNGRKVDAVVIPEAKTASENIYEFYAYKAMLKRRHSDLVIASDEAAFPGYGLCEKFMNELIDTMCRVDVENKPLKTNNGRIDKAARGAYIGGKAPMGYRVEDGKLVVNPDEVPVVEFILGEKRLGRTKKGTMEKLNADGYRTRSGKPFVISTVQSVWNNEMFYKGYYRYGKDGEWVKGQHEPIVKEGKNADVCVWDETPTT